MSDITTSDIQNAEQLLLTFINERYPLIDTRKGSAFRKLVISPAAAVYALINAEGTELRNSFTPDALEDVDDSVVDAVLSNWFVTRKTGEKAIGIVKVALSSSADLDIAEGLLFKDDGGRLYGVVGNHQYRREVTATGQEEIFQDNESSEYFVLVPVQAQEVGSAGNLTAATLLILDTNTSLQNVLYIETYTQFAQGSDAESTDSYKARVKDQLSVRNLVTKKSIKAALLEDLNYVSKVVVKGYGDPEMIRDITYPALVHIGGSTDIYVATDIEPSTLTFTTTLNSPFTFEITSENGGPIYKINSVRAELEGSLVDLVEGEDFTVTYGVTDWFSTQPDILEQAGPAGRLSTKEKITITFTSGYKFAVPSDLLHKRVVIECDVPGRLQEVDAYVQDDEERRILLASLLVKALFPVYVTVSLNYQDYGTPIDTAALAEEIASYVRSVDLSKDTITVSKIIAIAEKLGVKRVVQPVTISAEVITNYGETLDLATTDQLIVPENIEYGFTREICQAFCNPSESVIIKRVV